MNYRVVSEVALASGAKRLTVSVDRKLYSFKASGDNLVRQIYQAMIDAEPNIGRKQEIARRRHQELSR